MAEKLCWLGHAFFEIETSAGQNILIDPFWEDNPAAGSRPDQGDIILITHDHFDHCDNLEEFLAADGIIVGQPEVLNKIRANSREGLQDENLVLAGSGMNIGGTVNVKDVDITMVQAFHSSDAGSPAGYIINTPAGKTFYHAGDTGIFGGMDVLGDIYDIDIALLPIGSVFTMDPKQAAHAVKLLQPETVVPMHYGTFEVLVQSADEFCRLVAQNMQDVEVMAIEPGETMEC